MLAGLYVLWWAQEQTESPDWSLKVREFGVAFFLIMWGVGQYMRVDKSLTDRASMDTIITELKELRGVYESGAARSAPTSPSDPLSAQLLAESRGAITDGHAYSGALAAAVAFEYALRATVQRLEGPRKRHQWGVRRSIESLKGRLDKPTIVEMHLLADARNKLVHAVEPPTDDSAQVLSDSFAWAITELEALWRDGLESTDK